METVPVMVVVNDEEISLSGLLRSMGARDDWSLFDHCARKHLIFQIAQREEVDVSLDAVQKEVDEWRYQNQLESAEDTEDWLTRRGVNLDDITSEVRYKLLEQAIKERVTKGQIEPYFAQHMLDFDEAEVYWIHVSDEGIAQEIQVQIVEEGGNFYELARCYSEDKATQPTGGHLGRLRRKQLPKGVAPMVFAAKSGDVIGPLRTRKKYALYFIQEAFPAILTEAIVAEIQELLFHNWLKREMRQAEIKFPVIEVLQEEMTRNVNEGKARSINLL